MNKFDPQTAIPLDKAKGVEEDVILKDCVYCELPGDRRVEVWRVEGKENLSIRTFRPDADGQIAMMKFGLTYDAAVALYSALDKQLGRIEEDRKKKEK